MAIITTLDATNSTTVTFRQWMEKTNEVIGEVNNKDALASSLLKLTHSGSANTAGIFMDSINAPDGMPFKRITWNDGFGNFVIRTGSYVGAGVEKYAVAGHGAALIRMNHETVQGAIYLDVAPIGTNAGDAVTYKTLSLLGDGTITWNGSKVWTAGNDGAASGLDADLLDGVQGSSFARLDTTNTFTAPFADTLRYTRSYNLTANTTDLDTITTSGFYDVAHPINGPGTGWWYVEVQRHTSATGYCLQRAVSLNGGDPLEYIRHQKASTWSAWYTSNAAYDYDTLATAAGKFIPTTKQIVVVGRYDSNSVYMPARYKRVASQPSHYLRFQDANGQWWEIAETEIYPEMSGTLIDGTSGQGAAFQRAVDAAAGRVLKIVNATIKLNTTIYVPDYSTWMGHNAALIKETFSSAFYMFRTKLIDGSGTNIHFEGISFVDLLTQQGWSMFGLYGFNNSKFINCRITKSSMGWCTVIAGNNITIDRFRVYSRDAVQYSDAIHVVAGRDITISNCDLDTEDDCIALTVNRDNSTDLSIQNLGAVNDGIIENVTITNCILKSKMADALRIGTHWAYAYLDNANQTPGSRHVKNVTMSNCVYYVTGPSTVGAAGIMLEDPRSISLTGGSNRNILIENCLFDIGQSTGAGILCFGRSNVDENLTSLTGNFNFYDVRFNNCQFTKINGRFVYSVGCYSLHFTNCSFLTQASYAYNDFLIRCFFMTTFENCKFYMVSSNYSMRMESFQYLRFTDNIVYGSSSYGLFYVRTTFGYFRASDNDVLHSFGNFNYFAATDASSNTPRTIEHDNYLPACSAGSGRYNFNTSLLTMINNTYS